MLYVTTRDNSNPHTAYRAIHDLRNSDGGFYVPFRHPQFDKTEIDELCQLPFGKCVAQILNRLINTRLTQWDIDFHCGRNPVLLKNLAHKTFVAEAWHSRTESFEGTIRGITELVNEESGAVSDWLDIAVRAAVWFGIFGDLKGMGIDQADVSVVSGDFHVPMSAWYARHWGLPIGEILCCCNENNSIWELLSHGQMRTDMLNISTVVPEADVSVPVQLERLVYEAGGIEETGRYLDAVRHGRSYHPCDMVWTKLRRGMYPAVISSHRLADTIPSLYRTNGYRMTAATALAYAGAQDYRAQTGQTSPMVIWAEENPCSKFDTVSSFGIEDGAQDNCGRTDV